MAIGRTFRVAVEALDTRTREYYAPVLSESTSCADVVALLRSAEESSLRRAAADFLGVLRDRRMAPPLIEALKSDPDPNVRGVAADALGRLDGGKRRGKSSKRAVGP